MAVLEVIATTAFDFRSVNFNWFLQNKVTSGVRQNDSAGIAGSNFTDVFYIVATLNGVTRELNFAGSGITVDAMGRITGGTIAAISEIDRNSNVTAYSLNGISLAAVGLFAAAESGSNSDELDLLRTALSGADTLTLSDLADYVEGSDGDDVIYGLGGRNILLGGNGNDALFGGPDNDYQIIGGAGDDLLDGGSGYDNMYGGLGNDTYVVDSSVDLVFERVDEGIDTVISYRNYSTLEANVENLTLGIDLSASLEGNDLNNRIIGGVGNDRLDGRGGDDALFGNGGIDVARYLRVDRGDANIERAADGTLVVTSLLDGTDTISRVELLHFRDGLFSFQFEQPDAPVLGKFGGSTGGWSSQDRYPRHVADLNGDGYADIVGFGQAGVQASFGLASGGFTDQVLVSTDFGQATGWSSNSRFHRELADVNGDGRADIIGFGVAGTLVALARADGSFADPSFAIADFGTSQGWESHDAFTRIVGDVNGDGRADIVGFGTAGILVSLARADGTFASPTLALADYNAARGWSSNNLYPRAIGDVNGDGRDDVIGFGSAGTYVSLALEDGTFGAPKFVFYQFGRDQGWTSQDQFTRQVKDVSGDGYVDIVGFRNAGTYISFGYDGQAYGIYDSSLKPAAMFFEPAFDVANFGNQQGWQSDDATHRELADINNDGALDIVGFGPAGLLISLNQAAFGVV